MVSKGKNQKTSGSTGAKMESNHHETETNAAVVGFKGINIRRGNNKEGS